MARTFVTDGGMETDLIFHHGVDLPCFASFPLLEDAGGRKVLEGYYDGYAEIAARAGAGLVLETPTWRANAEWGARLGYTEEALARVNADAVAMMVELRARYQATVPEVLVSGAIGPRGDGYHPDAWQSPEEAEVYHRPQIEAFARAGADLVTAYTLTHVGEAAGIVRSARATGIPVTISFTVETDGRLPDGTLLADAVTELDATDPPDAFGVNCAHPTHIEAALAHEGAWRDRITLLRPNASILSHAELDEAEDLDEGDPVALATAYTRLTPLLPHLTVLGGCCGTDTRHVTALWNTAQPKVNEPN